MTQLAKAKAVGKLWQVAVTATLICLLVTPINPVYPQARKPLRVNNIGDLLKSGVSANRIVQIIETHGVAFELDDRALRRLKQDGATEAVLTAVKKMSARYAKEKERMKRQEETAQRLREEQAKLRADEERRRLADLERKRRDKAEQQAEEARRRQQKKEQKEEEESRRAQELKRKQAEAAARLAEEQRRQEEMRLAEEKRRVEEARREEANRKEQEEIEARNKEALIAKRKIEEEKRRADAQSRMLDAMKNGHNAAPIYKDGDFWHFNVIENYTAYDSRALKGVYEIRYSRKRFLVFKEKQRITANEGQIGVVLAMVDQRSYMGGQYLKFPLSIGQKWSHQYESGIRASPVVLSWDSETTVKSVEKVTTSAGTFWALKIVRDAWSHRGSKATFTYYYSPQTKSIVKMLWEFPNDSRSVELIKLGSGQ